MQRSRAMSEIPCYSIDIPMDEMYTGYNILPDMRKMDIPCKQKGFLGVNPDYRHGILHFLYDTPAHRNRAYNKIHGKFKLCAVNVNVAYVDEKYLKSEV